jgi:hypothetical protein
MAGNDNWQRIASIGSTHRPTGGGLSNGPGDFLIACRGSKRNLLQGLPDPLLKRCSGGLQREIELLSATGEVLSQLVTGAFKNLTPCGDR